MPVKPLKNTSPVKELADCDSKFIEVDGLEIHYKQSGQSEQDLVLLHGFGASLFSWHEVTAPLAQFGVVITYDRPAFGLTERPMLEDWERENPYPNTYQPKLLVALMDKIGIEKAILIGNSAGGTLAVQTALEYSERVEALVLISPAIITSEGTPSFLAQLFGLPAIDRIGPLITRFFLSRSDVFIKNAWHDPAKIPPKTIDGYKKILLADNWDKALWEFVKASKQIDLVEELDELNLPILVVAGDDDRIVSTADSVRVAGLIPGAQLVILPECGHVPQEECPEEFLMAVEKFLDQIRAEKK